MVALGRIGAAESSSGFGGAANVVIVTMVTAIARTIPKTNVSDFRVRAMVSLLAPDRCRWYWDCKERTKEKL
jgi:hypothetical protein